ncbi:response regulator [Saccharibacillus sp. O23]|uniref:response regulator n=1 Tax=Saccharibacillus sp. O23 TaxID=2009338 RepID=UPI00211AD73D|nr:response regulator [Saccharibacillus sp. O23]
MWTVLLVEDEVFVRESVREIISWEELGFRVIGESGNGEEALGIIRRERPDLVLSDIVMPGIDGIELLRRARAEGVRSKFVMLTCMGEFEYVRQAMEYGASNYILKLSMSVNSLRDTLRKVGAELAGSAADGSGRHSAVEQGSRIEEKDFSPEAQQASANEKRGRSEPADHRERAGTSEREPSSESEAAFASASLSEISGLPSGTDSTDAADPADESERPADLRSFRLYTESDIAHPEVRRIVEHIHAHYESDITVKSMSRYVMMGENYVSALFKKKTGHTLIHYLHGVRIVKAADRLRETGLPVQEIGLRVGFANDNYFIKIFKRWTGLTPSQYRQRERSSS